MEIIKVGACAKDHFRVPPDLCFKTRLSALPLIWKYFLILMEIKLIFTRRLSTWPHFKNESFWNSEEAYLTSENDL